MPPSCGHKHTSLSSRSIRTRKDLEEILELFKAVAGPVSYARMTPKTWAEIQNKFHINSLDILGLEVRLASELSSNRIHLVSPGIYSAWVWVRLEESKKVTSTCACCKGTGTYTGLFEIDVCRTCKGEGKVSTGV